MNEWLLQFQTVKDWLAEVKAEKTGSAGTARNGLRILGEFCRFMKMNPDELIEAARQAQLKEMTSGLEKKTWAEKQTLAFFNALADGSFRVIGSKIEKQARTGAKMYYGYVRSFFRHNGIVFKGKTPQATQAKQLELPEPETLTKIWKAASIDEKLPLGLLRSTGWRPEDVVDLTWNDVKDSYERNEKNIFITKVTQKEDLPVAVCLTEETTEILRLIVERRKQKGEMFTDETKLLPYRYDNLLTYVNNAGERVGVHLVPKIFRKWFRTKCSPIIGKDAVFKMAGWALPGVGRSYELPTRKDTVERYKKVEQLLTFEPKVANAEEIAKVVQFNVRQTKTEAGGLSFEQTASKALARIIMGALKEVISASKEETSKPLKLSKSKAEE